MEEVIKTQDTSLLTGKVAVLGYGSQGHAHALNLADSGIEVEVGLRPDSSSRAAAEDAGPPRQGRPRGGEGRPGRRRCSSRTGRRRRSSRDEVAPNLSPGAAVLFAHGFSVHYGRIVPPADHDVIMVAPKGPGHIVRRLYEEGYGTPALIAVANDASGQARELALAYAAGDRRGPRRDHRDDVPERDRDRPLRRAEPCSAAGSPS